MEVDTGSFRALTEQVADLGRRVTDLEQAARFARAFERETATRELVTGQARRPRHLRVVDGGAS